jgi:hypothetical protein
MVFAKALPDTLAILLPWPIKQTATLNCVVAKLASDGIDSLVNGGLPPT